MHRHGAAQVGVNIGNPGPGCTAIVKLARNAVPP